MSLILHANDSHEMENEMSVWRPTEFRHIFPFTFRVSIDACGRRVIIILLDRSTRSLERLKITSRDFESTLTERHVFSNVRAR